MSRHYQDLTPAEAQVEFERFVGLQPEWSDQFVELVKNSTGIVLDYTVESIEPAWQFVLDHEGDIGHIEPDPWMTLNPYAERHMSTAAAWRVGLFAAYRYVTISRHADTHWFLGNEKTKWTTSLNEPILQIGADYGMNSPASSHCLPFKNGAQPTAIVERTKRQIADAGVPEPDGTDPLYEVEQFYDDVNLTYCEEILDSDDYNRFLDKVHKQFIKRFGSGEYLESYDDSFIVEEPTDIAETIRIATEIAEQAGDPRHRK